MINITYRNWKIARQHWEKNRRLFIIFFRKMIIPIRFLKIFEKKKIIDLNLILAWRKPKHINLCSTFVLQTNNLRGKEQFFCLTSLFNRPIRRIFCIEKLSGCICCANDINKEGPIWWDQSKDIKMMFNVHLNKLFTKILYRFSILKAFAFLVKKKILTITKIPKIFNIFFACFALKIFLIHKKFIFNVFQLNKQWVLLF